MMDNSIKAALSTFLAPVIDQIKQKAVDEALSRQKTLPKPHAALEAETEKMGVELEKFLLGEEDVDRMESGFALCLEELEKLPEKDAVLEEFKQAAERLAAEQAETDSFEVPVYETVQEMLRLSSETFQALYGIGSHFFNTGKIEEAQDVFILLTTLNNLVFEPWLGLGCCRQQLRKFPEALQAFSMASLVDFHHPAPHLFAAECYLEIQADRLAKETLALALSKMDARQKNTYKPHIDYMNKNLKERNL